MIGCRLPLPLAYRLPRRPSYVNLPLVAPCVYITRLFLPYPFFLLTSFPEFCILGSYGMPQKGGDSYAVEVG
jgi:hypothetical protein